MLKQSLFVVALCAGLGLVACEKKDAPAGGAAGAASGALDSAKKAAGGATDAVMKAKDELVAKATETIAGFEKSSEGWKAKIDALPAGVKEGATKLWDDFKGALTSAKDSVAKLKDATAASAPDLTTKANDAIKKVTDAFNAVKAKVGG